MCCLVYICNKTFLYLMVNVDEFRLHPHMVPSETWYHLVNVFFLYIIQYTTFNSFYYFKFFSNSKKKSLFFFIDRRRNIQST